MLGRVQRPAWAEMVIVVADAALASTATIQLIRPRGYVLVMALARTWCFDQGHARKALVAHVPKHHDRRCWGPLEEPGRRRTSWPATTRARLRHLGDVTSMLRQKRRHDGPNATNIVVTNLPAVSARQVVDVDRRRWTVDRLIKALQGATGLGQHQVTKAPQRVERSVAMSVMAYLVIVKFRAHDLPERGSWSLLTLKQNLTWPLAHGQLERAVKQRLSKGPRERKAA